MSDKPSLAQEIAETSAMVAKVILYPFRGMVSEQQIKDAAGVVEEAISERLAPLERERDTFRDAVRYLGLTDKEIGEERVWKNTRAETAESSLSSLSLAVEELLKIIKEEMNKDSWMRDCDRIRAAAERARSLVVK